MIRMYICQLLVSFFFFFFNDTATTEIYPLPLPDALPISGTKHLSGCSHRIENGTSLANPHEIGMRARRAEARVIGCRQDRKSTRLNSSHANISYAVFCLKKKKMIIFNINSIYP